MLLDLNLIQIQIKKYLLKIPEFHHSSNINKLVNKQINIEIKNKDFLLQHFSIKKKEIMFPHKLDGKKKLNFD